MHRYELTDAEWERIAPCFPDRTHHGGAGHPWNDHRPLVNGILWRLHTGAPWPDVPARYGPWQTVYDRFNRWRKDGTWATILDALLLRLDTRGCIDRDLWMVDGSVVRATRATAGAKKKIPTSGPGWTGRRRSNSRNRQIMRWAARGAGSEPRSTWSATATGSSWPLGHAGPTA